MAAPRFDPTSAYTTTVDVDGNVFFFQYPNVFDRYGNSAGADIPPSHNGQFQAPYRTAPMATIVNAIQAGQLPYTLQRADVGTILDVLAAGTITIPPGFTNYSVIFIPPASGTLTIAAGAGVLLNGAGTSLTRTRASNAIGFGLIPTSTLNSYLVGGS